MSKSYLLSLLLCGLLCLPSLGYGVELELVDGSVLNGEITEVTETTCTLSNTMGSFTIKQEALIQESQKQVAFKVPVQLTPAEEITTLKAEIQALRTVLAALQKDNEKLRNQMAKDKSAKLTASALSGKSGNIKVESQKAASTGFWLSKSGKRHNERCRYYQTGDGRPCSSKEGEPCKICGG